MKIQILIVALLIGSAVAQYNTNINGGVILPSTPPTSTNPSTPQAPI